MAKFSYYDYNGGSVIAIRGTDFALIGSDTRFISENKPNLIWSRQQPKLFQLTKHVFLGATGCSSDVKTLVNIIDSQIRLYSFDHRKDITFSAISEMISSILYVKQLVGLHYYAVVILAGLDSEGKGCVYEICPYGFPELVNYSVLGVPKCVLPLMDIQISANNINGRNYEPPAKEKAIAILKDAFQVASERFAFTGDSCTIRVITKDKVHTEYIQLRGD